MSPRTVARALAEARPLNVKDAVHSTLTAAGFDGNGRFRSHSEGIARLHDALHKHGLTVISHVQAPVGSTPSGHHTLDLGWLHPEGKEDPKPADASIHVQWTNLTHTPGDVGPHGDMPTAKPPRFEFLAYIPHSKLSRPVTSEGIKELASKAIDAIDATRRDITGVHSARQIRKENPHLAAALAKGVKERGVAQAHVAANQFKITSEPVDGGGTLINIHDPAGAVIGGVHRGQMFLKRGALKHREAAAKAWRAYKGKTGHDGQDGTFDGVMERAVVIHQGDGLHPKTLAKVHAIAAKHGGQHVGWGPGGVHFKFKDGHDENFRDEVGKATGGTVRTGYVKEHINADTMQIEDPVSRAVMEWRVFSADAVSVLVEHPDTKAAVSFPVAAVLG